MKRLLAFCLSHWSKAAIMGFLITLIVLVSIKVGMLLASCHCGGGPCASVQRMAACLLPGTQQGAIHPAPSHTPCLPAYLPDCSFRALASLGTCWAGSSGTTAGLAGASLWVRLMWGQVAALLGGDSCWCGTGRTHQHLLLLADHALTLTPHFLTPPPPPPKGMYTAMVALFLPGVVLILGSGFVFGFWRGLLAVWAGGAVGQALAFLLARYLFRDWVESTLRTKWRKWAIIDKAIEHDGWKLVLIMRFSPIIPYNLVRFTAQCCHVWSVSASCAVLSWPPGDSCPRRHDIFLPACLPAPTSRCSWRLTPSPPPLFPSCSSTLRWPLPPSPSGSLRSCQRWALCTSAPSSPILAGGWEQGRQL